MGKQAIGADEARYVRAWYMLPGMSIRELAKLSGLSINIVRACIEGKGPYAIGGVESVEITNRVPTVSHHRASDGTACPRCGGSLSRDEQGIERARQTKEQELIARYKRAQATRRRNAAKDAKGVRDEPGEKAGD